MRILLDNMSHMLRGIVTNIVASDPQCEIVAAPSGPNTLSGRISAARADVVILAAANSSSESDQIFAVLSEHPTASVIAIASGGNQAFLYDLRPHITLIGELSPSALLSAIKLARPLVWQKADAD